MNIIYNQNYRLRILFCALFTLLLLLITALILCVVHYYRLIDQDASSNERKITVHPSQWVFGLSREILEKMGITNEDLQLKFIGAQKPPNFYINKKLPDNSCEEFRDRESYVNAVLRSIPSVSNVKESYRSITNIRPDSTTQCDTRNRTGTCYLSFKYATNESIRTVSSHQHERDAPAAIKVGFSVIEESAESIYKYDTYETSDQKTTKMNIILVDYELDLDKIHPRRNIEAIMTVNQRMLTFDVNFKFGLEGVVFVEFSPGACISMGIETMGKFLKNKSFDFETTEKVIILDHLYSAEVKVYDVAPNGRSKTLIDLIRI